jgi:hypothetical protein
MALRGYPKESGEQYQRHPIDVGISVLVVESAHCFIVMKQIYAVQVLVANNTVVGVRVDG